MKGIDISMHNRSIDFNKVKAAGIEVVIIKATEGIDYVDPKLEEHYIGAIRKDLNIGFYHFMSEQTSPSQQAVDFYNAIKDKEYNVIPCLDIETNNQGRSAAQITDRCLEFINKFKAISGQTVMIYTGGYFGRDSLDGRIKGYPCWAAHYGVNKPMEMGFANVVGHQYTEKGQVNGIGTNVDMNNFTEGILLSRANSPIINNSTFSSNWLSDYLRTWNWTAWVEELQTECNRQKYSKQSIDGKVGPKTIAGCPTIKQGASGNITKLLQRVLRAYGFDCGNIDGAFGDKTYNAVIEFQKSRSLVPDGIVGKNTWKALLGL